jgi:type VI secretion system Hcp family effector
MAPDAVRHHDPNFLLEAYWTCAPLETGSKMKGMEKATRLLGFEYGAESPHDAAAGHTTGRVRNNPFVIHKYVDKSSPLAVQALVRNENINECKISYFANKEDGSGKIKQFEVTLSKLHVIKVDQVAGGDARGVTERIAFTFDKIVMVDVPSTKQVEYSWDAALNT